MTTKDILTVQKTNEVHTMLFDWWEKIFRLEMNSSDSIPCEVMGELRSAIDKAMDEILHNARQIKIK